jgi:hypothetical protein
MPRALTRKSTGNRVHATTSEDNHNTLKGRTPAPRNRSRADTKSNSESSFACISILLLMDTTDAAKSGVQAATKFLSMILMAFSGQDIEGFVSVVVLVLIDE